MAEPNTVVRLDDGRELVTDAHGFVTGEVRVEVGELVRHDLEGVLDLLSERLTGTDLLMETEYEAVGVEDGVLVMRVSGNPDAIIETRAPDGEDGPSPAP